MIAMTDYWINPKQGVESVVAISEDEMSLLYNVSEK
jgi:hypothetical protein